MDNSYHYPPELLNLLVDTIPLLCRSKNDVVVFFKGSGVVEEDIKDITYKVRYERHSINKYEIARNIIQLINAKGDSCLRIRREVIKRVAEFDNFSSCWPADQLKAKGLVVEVGKVVNIKDSFTRIKKEHEKEREARASITRKLMQKEKDKKTKIEKLKGDLYALFALNDEPQKRGKLLETVLNELFRINEVLVREDFKRVDPDGAGIIEQIDGVIDFEGNFYLVEMKWVKDPIGVDKIGQHLVRIFSREGARGLFIAANGYAESTLIQCKEALDSKVIALIDLQEIVSMLESRKDFKKMLQAKIQAAIVDKNPYLQMLT